MINVRGLKKVFRAMTKYRITIGDIIKTSINDIAAAWFKESLRQTPHINTGKVMLFAVTRSAAIVSSR